MNDREIEADWSGAMRIEVRSERDSVAKEVQIYAEYRVFSVLHRFAPGIELILVNVNESGRGDETTGAECEIDVRLVDGGHAHIASAGSHAAVAIDSGTTAGPRSRVKD